MKYLYAFLTIFFGVVLGNIATFLLFVWLLWEFLTVNIK